MYGETITMMDSLVITLFSMGLVFVTLLSISYFIDLIAAVVNKKVKPANVEKTASPIVTETVVEETQNDEELIAVISAAIAATSGKSLNTFIVRSVRPTESHESAWSRAGRAEAMR